MLVKVCPQYRNHHWKERDNKGQKQKLFGKAYRGGK